MSVAAKSDSELGFAPLSGAGSLDDSPNKLASLSFFRSHLFSYT